jgi:hypothetical protein
MKLSRVAKKLLRKQPRKRIVDPKPDRLQMIEDAHANVDLAKHELAFTLAVDKFVGECMGKS